ncbi:response regulator transcription factor [Rubrobacter calidifluminis]|uniref:response regulator transcription factor n=1 Tax=Rubrobacter calidifluminis TaxID=1392640 RepID=UPI0030811E97
MNRQAKILVADDDRIVRRIVAVKLSGLGYEVSEAEDGREVLDHIENGEVPDLLVLDSLMPRVDGMSLIRTLRANPDRRISSLPVIMLTSRGSERDVVDGLEAGLDDYVTKPFSPDELAARVRTVLQRNERAAGR